VKTPEVGAATPKAGKGKAAAAAEAQSESEAEEEEATEEETAQVPEVRPEKTNHRCPVKCPHRPITYFFFLHLLTSPVGAQKNICLKHRRYFFYNA
jgi:TPP-dependent indolepyruvate ferredoxin oxidoreductase alpha subunit